MSKTGLAVVGVLLTLLCGSVSSYAEAPDEPKEAVHRHVQVTYDVLSTLPLSQRRAVFGQASGTAKADLWQLHLDAYVAQHPDLSAEQQAVIEDAIRFVRGGDLFAVGDAGADWQPVSAALSDLQIAAIRVFSYDEQVSIFGTLGSAPEPPSIRPATNESPIVMGSGSRNWRVSANPVMQNVDCECSIQSDLCWSGSWCKSGTGCRTTGMGCGWFWLNPCDGTCQRVYP